MKKAHVLLFDGYADWEIGNLLAELRRMGKVEVVAVGFTGAPVTSMGGLHVQPDVSLAQVDFEDVLVFILPGGEMWEAGYPETEIEQLLARIKQRDIPLAAICAATTVLARHGMLTGVTHTSNSLEYMMNMVPDYAGEADFVEALAVTDKHVTTASGLGALEFTLEVLKELDLVTPDMCKMWFDAFKYGIFPEGYGGR